MADSFVDQFCKVSVYPKLTGKQRVFHFLENEDEQAKGRSIGVKLCIDSDQVGRDMAQQVADIASRQEITCQMEFPEGVKDWNDMLVAHLKQSAQLDQQQHTTFLSR